MPTLYHARRAPEEEQKSLSPTTNAPQQRNDRFGQFLFATHRLDQAYLYALPFPGPGAIGPCFMSTLDPFDPASALTRFRADRSGKARSETFSNKIYSMDSAGFEQVVKNPREWIIDHPVHDIALVDHVTSLDQALKKGVQYFTISNDAPDVPFDESPFKALEGAAIQDDLTADKLAQAIAENPHIVWENEADGFGVDPKLAHLVDAKRLALLEGLTGQRLGSEPAPRPHAERMAIKDALSMARALSARHEAPDLPEPNIAAKLALRKAKAGAEPAQGPARLAAKP